MFLMTNVSLEGPGRVPPNVIWILMPWSRLTAEWMNIGTRWTLDHTVLQKDPPSLAPPQDATTTHVYVKG